MCAEIMDNLSHLAHAPGGQHHAGSTLSPSTGSPAACTPSTRAAAVLHPALAALLRGDEADADRIPPHVLHACGEQMQYYLPAVYV